MKNLEYKTVTHLFDPVYDEKSRILILGTFPSVKSREQEFYYGHKQNRFWRLIADLLDETKPDTIEEKKTMLLKHRIAVWDVISSCDIIGSSDNTIKNVIPTDLSKILTTANIKTIYTNGAKAGQLYRKYQLQVTGIENVTLPSTSPANASYSYERIRESWSVLLLALQEKGL